MSGPDGSLKGWIVDSSRMTVNKQHQFVYISGWDMLILQMIAIQMYGKKVANPNSPWSWLTLGNLHKVCKQAPFSISQIQAKLYRTPCEEITLDGHFVAARLLTSMNLWGLQRETSRWIQDSTSVRRLFSRCDKQLHVLGWMKGEWNLPQDCFFLCQ